MAGFDTSRNIFLLILIIHGTKSEEVQTNLEVTKETSTSPQLPLLELKWIKQPLDHFDLTEPRTWNMRYVQSLRFWVPNGPIYLDIGGADRIEHINWHYEEGLLYDLANETQGAMIGAEHRYYGHSMPLDNTKTENLKYLNTRQALADFANLVKHVKSALNSTASKVVVIGGSLIGNAGGLAAWMRLFYSDLVDVAVSSSGTYLAKKEFPEALEVLGRDFFKYGSPGCFQRLKKRYKRIEIMLKTPEGIEKVKQEESICNNTDMTTVENQQMYFYLKIFGDAVMVDFADNPEIFKVKCKKLFMNDHEGRLWNQKYGCFDYDFNNFKKNMDKDSWWYQKCTEFGHFTTTGSNRQPFGSSLPIEFFHKACEVQFGPEFGEKRINEGVKATNEMFGGLNPNVSKVIFVNNQFDPRYKLGIVRNLSDDAVAINVARSSHCQIQNPDFDTDSEELKAARVKVKSLVMKWIGL